MAFKSTASLRIFGKDLQPIDVTCVMGREPDLSFKQGQPIVLPDGRIGREATFGMWSISADTSSAVNLNDQIEQLLTSVTSELSDRHRLGQKYSIDLFCGIFVPDENRGIALESATLLRLGQ